MSCHVYTCFLGHIIEKQMDMISEPAQSAPLQQYFPQCVPTASNFCCQSLQHLPPLLPPESGQETEDRLELPAHDDVFRYVTHCTLNAAAVPPLQSTESHGGPEFSLPLNPAPCSSHSDEQQGVLIPNEKGS